MKRTLALLLLSAMLLTLPLTASADSDARNRLLTLFNQTYTAEKYTPESFAAYQAAVTEAVRLYDTAAATEEELSAAADQLQQAIDGLQPLLDRAQLLTYVEALEEYIYGVRYVFPDGMPERIIATRDNFNNLYQSAELTPEALIAAEQTYTALMAEIEIEVEEMSGFNNLGENPTLVVPTDYMENTEEEKNTGAVTQMRVNLVYLSVGCIAFGLLIMIIYFATSKKCNRKEPKKKK
ncbi:MAG: hypothetical protein J6C26_07645 [Clostridia bacterium]|nr:hypothetical protein [Clostridia bacterium]